MPKRPDWDRTWLDVAHVIAKRSFCSRAKVGAVIVDPTNRVVATAYNGPPARFMPSVTGRSQDATSFGDACDSDAGGTAFCVRGRFGPQPGSETSYDDCPSIHAELNAVAFVDRRQVEGGTLYVTSHVCLNCAKVVANSGIGRVVVEDPNPQAHRQPERSYELLRLSRLEVTLL